MLYLTHPYLENEAEIIDPLCVLQSRVPLGTDGGQTDRPEGVIAVSHGMNVRDVKVGQLRVAVV